MKFLLKVILFFVLIPSLAFAWTKTATFESGTIGNIANSTSGFDYAGTATKYSSDKSAGGSKSAKMSWTTGNEGWNLTHGEITYPQNVSNGQEIWARGYYYLVSPWSWANASGASEFIKILRIGTTHGFHSFIANGSGHIIASNEPAGFGPITSATLDINAWNCLEIYVKLSTTDPIYRMWKNGVLIYEDRSHVTLLNSGDVAIRSIIMSTWNGGVSQNQTEYVDDFVITTDTPAGRDATGHPMIGTLGSTSVDITAPVVTAFTVPATASNLTVPINTFAATDNVGVTNYCVTSTNSSSGCTWLSSPNTFFTFGSYGIYTVYAWAKDAAGNISTSVSDSVDITEPVTTPGTLFTESFEDTSYAARGWYDTTPQGTIVTGGRSGNAMQWYWPAGATLPTNGGAMRKLFTPTETLYISYYTKFQTGWRGSGVSYHPHMINILSDLDGDWAGPSNTYLNVYYEMLSDTISPYAVHPTSFIQDNMVVNTSYGTPPKDLTAITENRSVGRCNSPLAPGASVGDCYNAPPWYSTQGWYTPDTSVSLNAWHKVELYYQMNTVVSGIGQADGIMRVWIDGVQAQNRTDLTYRTGQNPTKKFHQFVFGPYIGVGSPIAQSMWIDELTVATAVPGSADITAPVVTAFTVPTTSTSLTVAVSGFTATDAVGVTNYCVTPTNSSANCDWLSSPNTFFTFANNGTGTYMAYAWAKDAAGNISSSVSDSVDITLDVIIPPRLSVISGSFTFK